MTLVHRPVLFWLPGLIQIQSYGQADLVSPQFVERVADFIAQATAVELTHTIRATFPKKLDRSIADEAVAAWSAVPKRRLRLSNELSHHDHMQLSVGLSPRKTDEGREFHGFVTVLLKAGSKAAESLAKNFTSLVELCGSDYARCHVSPGQATKPTIETLGQFVIPIAKDWLIAERLGWTSCFSRHAMLRLDATARAQLSGTGARLDTLPDGRGILSLPPPSGDSVAEAAVRQSIVDMLARHFD